VRCGSKGDRNILAFELSHRLDRRVLRNNEGIACTRNAAGQRRNVVGANAAVRRLERRRAENRGEVGHLADIQFVGEQLAIERRTTETTSIGCRK